MPNAIVYGLGTYQGVIRRYQLSALAVTDENGHYEIIGQGNLTFFSGTLVAKYARPNPASLTTGTQASLGIGGISGQSTGAQHLSGSVFLPVGVTPAFGAQLLYFEKGRTLASIFAMADARGNLQPSGMRSDAYPVEGAEPAQSSTLVAFLPGACGATIQTSPVMPDQPARVVLNTCLTSFGRVTVGGAAASKRPGSIQVLASYQDGGYLKDILSQTVTADADGRFTLAGLTPGNYLVQAALDRIWISSPVKLHVAAGDARPLALNIPLPGAAVRVHLRDAARNPMPSGSITIDHEGPWSSLWPKQWTSDGAGVIYIPTLEAGEHVLRGPGDSKAITLKVQPLPAKPKEIDFTLP